MSTTNTEKKFVIISGPNVDRIWDAAKYACDHRGARISTEFTGYYESQGSGAIQQVFISINGVQHEDGSGDSLIIKGYFNGQYFTGYYKGRDRRGWVTIQS